MPLNCSVTAVGNGMAEQTPHQHDGLWDFLRKRGVAEQNINQMQQDKVIPLSYIAIT